MKRIGTLMLAAALILSLAACSNSSSSMGSSLSSAGNALDGNASSETFGEMIDEVLPDVDYSLLRTGLGIVSSTAESAAAEGAIPGNAKFSATICALAVKPDGSIADVKFDTVEAGLAFDSSGTLTGDASQEIHTKKELGDDYGLKAASGIGKEWYEQIDALEIMGVNSASYLILPKIVASMIFFPFLTILSILIGVIGGWLIAAATGIMIPADYVDGLLMDFRPYSITYTLIKTVFFAYIITSISAFYGYYARGNSLEVGAASTRAVVASSIVILLFDLILTQVLLI